LVFCFVRVFSFPAYRTFFLSALVLRFERIFSTSPGCYVRSLTRLESGSAFGLTSAILAKGIVKVKGQMEATSSTGKTGMVISLIRPLEKQYGRAGREQSGRVMTTQEHQAICPHDALVVEAVGHAFRSMGEYDDDYLDAAYCPDCGLWIDYFRWPGTGFGEEPPTEYLEEFPASEPTEEE